MSDFLTDKQIAELFGVSIHTVRGWRYAGTGPKWMKIGRHAVRYARADVEAFIAAARAEVA